MPGRIPDRWEKYLPLGNAIEGTQFITFKVPLEKNMTVTLPKEEQFTPEDLVEMVKSKGHTLGLVIDLTNTNRYYSYKELTRLNVEYAKIYTEGHVVPSKKVRQKFFSTVNKFVNDKSNADKLVGVHCTHGVNRTGYLVCRYMIDVLDFEPTDALEAYGKARGYPVERENYIEDLKLGKSTESSSNSDDTRNNSKEEGEQEEKQRNTSQDNAYSGYRDQWQQRIETVDQARYDSQYPQDDMNHRSEWEGPHHTRGRGRRYGSGRDDGQGGYIQRHNNTWDNNDNSWSHPHRSHPYRSHPYRSQPYSSQSYRSDSYNNQYDRSHPHRTGSYRNHSYGSEPYRTDTYSRNRNGQVPYSATQSSMPGNGYRSRDFDQPKRRNHRNALWH